MIDWLLVPAVFAAGALGGSPAIQAECERPAEVQDIGFSRTKYPHIRAHMNRAIRKGWPSVMTLNRPGADARRDKALADYPTVKGYDRDEFPAAVGRSGWKAHIEYVPSSENRSHGAVLGIKLRRLCEGVEFRYVFY